MAHNLVDVDTWTAAVTVPDNGDAFNGAAFAAGMQDLADRTKYLYARSPGAGGVTMSIHLGQPVSNVDTRFTWAEAAGSGSYGWENSSVVSIGALRWDITAQLHAAGLIGGTLTAVTARLDGDAGGIGAHGALPNTVPSVGLVTRNSTTLALATAMSASDNSIDAPAYDASHAFSASGSVVLSAASRYFVFFTGEFGGTAQAGMTLGDITVTVTPA